MSKKCENVSQPCDNDYLFCQKWSKPPCFRHPLWTRLVHHPYPGRLKPDMPGGPRMGRFPWQNVLFSDIYNYFGGKHPSYKAKPDSRKW